MTSPAPLLADLLAAVQAGDGPAMDRLCRGEAQRVCELFPAWLSPPARFAEGSPDYLRYFDGLYFISKYMADCVGRGALFGQLVAPEQPNPFARWEAKINRSLKLAKEMRWEEAARVLTDHLIDARHQEGFGYSHMAATTHWYVSQCQMSLRRRDDAVGHAERSLRITEQIGDHPKYLYRYLRHLIEVHRYFGESAPAAGYARRLVEHLSELGDGHGAQLYRRQAEWLDVGEPLTRVVGWVGRRQYELADLSAELGDSSTEPVAFNLAIERNRPSLVPAAQLVRQARSALEQGGLDEALALAAEAASADPHDPEPHLLRGQWLLAAGRYWEAVEEFTTCEQLAPGWTNCRRDLWLARKLAAEELGPEALEVWAAPWQAEKDPERQLARARRVAEQFDHLALAHLHLAEHHRQAQRFEEAAAAYRDGLAREADEETRTRLLLGLAQVVQSPAEKERLLKQAADLNGDLIAAAAAQLMLQRLP